MQKKKKWFIVTVQWIYEVPSTPMCTCLVMQFDIRYIVLMHLAGCVILIELLLHGNIMLLLDLFKGFE